MPSPLNGNSSVSALLIACCCLLVCQVVSDVKSDPVMRYSGSDGSSGAVPHGVVGCQVLSLMKMSSGCGSR